MKELLFLKPKLILLCILLFTGAYYSIGQVSVNSNVFSDQRNFTPEEQLMLQQFIDNYDILTDLGNGYPPIWDNPMLQEKPMGIVVTVESNPRINDIPLEKYDYIGGFYTDDFGELRCGGAHYWPDSVGIVFALQRDNPNTPEKDGFSNNETIYFKLFSFSTMKDYMVDVMEFDPEYSGTNKWGSFVVSKFLDVQALEDLDFYIQPSNNPICYGDELTLSGQEFIGSGGNYTFQWSSNPSGFDYNVQFPPPVTPLETTTFTLIVDDGILSSEHSLTIEVSQLPTVDAGSDGEVCANSDFQLNGNAENSSSVIWTTDGNGEFDDPGLLNAVYTPGANDILSGGATLTLTALPLNPCDASIADEVSVSILPIPDISAGDDFIACTTQDVELFASANNLSTVQWTTSGSGTFTAPNSLNTIYVAEGNDFANGVNLTACAEAIDPCEATVCDVINVSFVPGPTVFGMTSTTACENNFMTVSGVAYNYSTTEWTTAGDGTFENPGAFSTKYYPGPMDISNEGVIVTLNAYPIGDCDAATKDVILNIVNLPNISFGPNSGNICVGDDFLQLDATVIFSNSIVWSTNGDGTFSNTHIANPKYYPGTQDEQNGQFELELLAYPLPYCSVNTIEPLLVTYQENPVSSAGQDAQICENETYTLSEASASSYSQLFWSGGNGTFSSSSTLKPTYTPAPQDYGTTVTLCLEAAPITPCDVASSDCMNLFVERLPSANAGQDAEICETDIVQLDGTVLYYENFEWTSDGDGFFSSANTEDPSYTPGAGDIQNGSVTLTLSAFPNAPCAVTAIDEMQLNIQLAVTASAGNDNVICDIQNHTLSTASAANYETLAWTTSGDGTFSNSSAVKPVYYPGTADINTGSVELTITATAVSPCAQDVIDTKTLSIVKSVLVDAGLDFEICETATHQLNGTVDNESSFIWTTSGDGQFSNVNIENPVYTPGSNDKAAGTVTLTLTAQPNSPCQASASDGITLDIQRAVSASAGNDNVICDIQNHTLSSASAANYETLAWTTSGDGTFSNPSTVNPVYYPGTADINTGSVELTITATAVSPCAQDVIDTKTLSIVKSVVVDAGSDDEICETATHQLNGTVDNESSFVWSTNGDGQFSNANIENPVYTPGSNDKTTGTVELTLTAQPNSPCQASASDGITLDIQRAVSASAGSDNVICDIQNHTLSSASAANYETLAWTTSGDGTFSNPSTVNPVYYPGTADINTGSIELTITATAVSPCAQDVIDTKTLSIVKSVVVDAGSDDEICETATHQLNGTVDNESSFIWTTSGDGQFSNVNIENPVYTPGSIDKAAGTVTLTLTAQPNSPCQASASDGITLDIQRSVSASAGNDNVICDIQNHTLSSASAANYETLAWTTSGDGTFSNPSAVNPVYYPGTADINTGSVELTITATATSPCNQDIVDTKTLSIVKSVVVDAGSDDEICETGTHQLNGTVDNESSYIWTTSGDGQFSSTTIENPVYTPGSNDKAAGTVTLTLTAQPNSPCQASASDGITLGISPSASLDIGEDIDVCATEPILLDDVVADGYASLLWTTSGDGTFNNTATENPLYYPGANDLLQGSVELILSLSPVSPCLNEVSDTKILSVAYPPNANAGQDFTSCGDEVALIGNAENYSSLIWTTNGDGTFDNTASLTPVYFPGETDIENKQVELSLIANANLPCAVAATDMILINFDILEMSEDNVVNKEVVVGNMLFLSFSVSSLSQGQYSWYFNGEIIPGQNNPMLLLTDMESVNAGYYQGKCVNNCGMVETNIAFIEVIQPFTHEIVIPQGWSGLSSFVTPDNPELETVFSGISDKVELMANNDGIYWPGQNVNTLGDMEVTDGYQIKMTESTTLSVIGNIRYPLNELVLSPGWSYLPVNTNCPVNIENQFGDLTEDVKMIKEIAGTGIYWPEKGINTIGELQPGKAYFILNESATELIMKYLGCE